MSDFPLRQESIGSLPFPFDCDAGLANFKLGWSEEKKEWCCKYKNKGCAITTIVDLEFLPSFQAVDPPATLVFSLLRSQLLHQQSLLKQGALAEIMNNATLVLNQPVHAVDDLPENVMTVLPITYDSNFSAFSTGYFGELGGVAAGAAGGYYGGLYGGAVGGPPGAAVGGAVGTVLGSDVFNAFMG